MASVIRPARIPDEFIENMEIEDSFEKLLDDLDVGKRVTEQNAVVSQSDGEIRVYFVQRYLVPGPDESERAVLACTCKDFTYNRLPYADDVEDVPETLADIGKNPCKHGERVLASDRMNATRVENQSGFEQYE